MILPTAALSGKPKTTSPPPPVSSPPPPPAPLPPARRKSGRFRRFILYLLLLSGVSYAGAVYYSLISDNFHDFFTEYIPFGEDAVFYFEEREFRRRFPSMTNPSSRASADSGSNVTIPSRSGLSWKVVDEQNPGTDLSSKGRFNSALDENKGKPAMDNAQPAPSNAADKEKTKAVEQAKGEVPPPSEATKPPSEKPNSEAPPPPKEAEKPPRKSKRKQKETPIKLPEVDEPSIILPVPRIDPLQIQDAEEPLVQDLVKIINDIIAVVNADNASGKYSSSISKAKSELAGVGSKIIALKEAEKKAAEAKIRSTQVDFDKAAKELVRRLEEEMRDQESHWKDEFETEHAKISETYQQRLETELQRSQELSDQRLRNQLLEQAVALKSQFLSEVKDRVETERSGRLSKLSDLSSSVSELESLSSEWNAVVDNNLATQHLLVAVEAVRNSLNNADRPRPFINELAALKELAKDNPIINAAIASINPTAYQRGVPTSAQLIDRFRRVAAEVRKASLLPQEQEEAGVASYAASWLFSKVLFKKAGLSVGDDVESVLTRTETLLEEGNLDEAAREMNTLGGWAKVLSGDWLGEVRRVLEVKQAVEVTGVEARLRSLAVE